jgi:hypothetical protein
MKNLKTFEDFLNEAILNEIGEGVKPFRWKRIGLVKLENWMNTLTQVDKADMIPNWTDLPQIKYSFSSDKAEYIVTVGGGWKRHVGISFNPKPNAPKKQDFDLVILIAFDTNNSKIGTDKEALTNFGEQFAVISTITDIIVSVVKELEEWEWVKLQEIQLAPKYEDEDTGKPIAQSKRGRLYLEYIKKQGRRLPGVWSVEIDNDRFTILRGTWAGSSFIKLT